MGYGLEIFNDMLDILGPPPSGLGCTTAWRGRNMLPHHMHWRGSPLPRWRGEPRRQAGADVGGLSPRQPAWRGRANT
uniref:Uncharacterized protein n=1 Tax=Setaria italica TaxID=4555 RepID=K3Y2N1_SETIT